MVIEMETASACYRILNAIAKKLGCKEDLPKPISHTPLFEYLELLAVYFEELNNEGVDDATTHKEKEDVEEA